MTSEINTKIRINFITALFSLLFALLGFSYNAWRMEVTEDNSNIRTASFEVLIELAELEQTIYALRYDKNLIEGSPRKGWVSVGLINELSVLINNDVHQKAVALKSVWKENWAQVEHSNDATEKVVKAINTVREEITSTLSMLK